VTVSGNNAVLVFQVDTSEVASLSGLTIANGTGVYGGGILNEPDARLTLTDTRWRRYGGCYSDGAGSPIFIRRR